MKKLLLFGFLLLFISVSVPTAHTQIISTTEDGRKALLFQDGHWEWMDDYILKGGKFGEQATSTTPVKYDTRIEGETLIISRDGREVERVPIIKPEFEGGRSYRILVGSAPYLFEGEDDIVYYLQNGRETIGSVTKPEQALNIAVGHYAQHVYQGMRAIVEGKEVVFYFEGEESGRVPVLGPEFETSGKYSVNIGEAPYLYLTEENEVRFMGTEKTGFAVSKEQAVDVAVHHFMQNVYTGTYGQWEKNTLKIYAQGKLLESVEVQKAKFEGARNFSLKVGDAAYNYDDDSNKVTYLGGQTIGKAASKEMALRICMWHYIENRK